MNDLTPHLLSLVTPSDALQGITVPAGAASTSRLDAGGALMPRQLEEMLALDPTVTVEELLPLLPHQVPTPTPTIELRGPKGQKRTLPGVFWPELATTQFQRPGRPIIGCWEITKDEAVDYLIEWKHKLHLQGEDYERPFGSMYFLMEVMGRPAAVVVLASSCNEWVSKKDGLGRYDCVDLSRICRSLDHRDDYCLRAVLRLAREYLVPLYPLRYPKKWSVIKAVCANSMPDTASAKPDGKTGMYRFDGFKRIRLSKATGGGGKRGKRSKTADIGDGAKGLWVYFYRDAQPEQQPVALQAAA